MRKFFNRIWEYMKHNPPPWWLPLIFGIGSILVSTCSIYLMCTSAM